MFEIYIEFVKKYLLFSAFIQFMILGMIGEYIGMWIEKKKVFNPYSIQKVILKMIAWGILGIVIKFAFTGFFVFTFSLLKKTSTPDIYTNSHPLSLLDALPIYA